jgi:hypothetical protein
VQNPSTSGAGTSLAKLWASTRELTLFRGPPARLPGRWSEKPIDMRSECAGKRRAELQMTGVWATAAEGSAREIGLSSDLRTYQDEYGGWRSASVLLRVYASWLPQADLSAVMQPSAAQAQPAAPRAV